MRDSPCPATSQRSAGVDVSRICYSFGQGVYTDTCALQTCLSATHHSAVLLRPGGACGAGILGRGVSSRCVQHLEALTSSRRVDGCRVESVRSPGGFEGCPKFARRRLLDRSVGTGTG